MQIHWAQFPELESARQAAAEDRIRRLAQGHDDLLDVHIVAQPTNHHRHGGQRVKLSCMFLGRQVVASCESEDLELALHEVLEGLERQIHKLRELRREDRDRAPTLEG
jgi:ribosomal subunit interface protein